MIHACLSKKKKCKEFEMHALQQSNWYHRGDGDQRAAVLMEKSHSLPLLLIEWTQSHHEVIKVVVFS